MKNSYKSKIALWQVIILIFAVAGLAVAIDQSPYPDKAYDWYQLQQLQYDLRCQGEASWLREAAIEVMKQANHDPLENISLAYKSPRGVLSTCVSGLINNSNTPIPVQPTTIYQFASVTKVFTADLILDLVRQGKLSLNDKLVDLLPELRNKTYKDARVTDIEIKYLLAHTAGFDREILGVGDNIFTANPWCPNHVEQLAETELQFSPDEKMIYSNIGYCLLSRIAEEQYQQSYRDIIRQRYHLSDFNHFDFITDNETLPIVDNAIKPLYKFYNYQSLSSSAGLYGDASSLVAIVDDMEKSQQPNITNRPNNGACDISVARGCHGFMGYEYSTDSHLRFYWRDGSMVSVAALLIIDDKGGTMAMLTNVRKDPNHISQLVEYIYQYRLANNI
ncbi:serine hydrolase domain-containing protein [Psychrobacter sp. 1Y1]|uniref:serine hydrolase domain-containing protein n=1 Tax=Psychrobacter sp. 1Y1 TaxID=3453574 RepID=UPI003F478E81